jgi:ABC-type sugar transport system ATPase subunit
VLEIRALDVAIAGVPVLHGVDLAVPHGAIAALVGHNGAGKTTLMRAIMGLVAARDGAVRFDDRDLRALPPHARAGLGIGYMPEDLRLVPELTVEENVLLPVWASGEDGAAGRLAWIYEMIPEVHGLRPRLSVTLEDADGVVLEADFGAENTDGLLQYMRLRDRAGLYLMSGFVGQEWQTVAKGGTVDGARPTRSLVPLALDAVAAVEIFARSKSYRLERDPTGAWLLHRHAPGDDPNMVHRADPAQSERIAQALATFGRTPIERSIARDEPSDAYGLVGPETIIVLFTKDEARPPLSFTIGDLASNGLDRYLLLPDGREIVAIWDAPLSRLIDVAEALEP